MKLQKVLQGKWIFSTFLVLVLIALGSAAHASPFGTITGNVVKSDGSTGIANVTVTAFTVPGLNNCGIWVAVSAPTPADGSFSIDVPADPAGYIIYADASLYTYNAPPYSCQPYVDGYYKSADFVTQSCQTASIVSDSAPGLVIKLKDGHIISGNVTDGVNPIVDAGMVFSTSKCFASGMGYGQRPTNSNGDYCVAVEDGNYYIKTEVRSFHPTYPYLDEWYTSTGGTQDCAQAEAINITGADVSGKDFVLENGATISGYVYNSAGNVITGTSIQIGVVKDAGTPCQSNEWMGTAWSDSTTGYYEILGLPAGDYYVRVSNNNGANYVNEWYTGGSPDPSNFDCSQAAKVTVSAGGSATDKNFRLDAGATISGTVYRWDGTTPLTDAVIQIQAIQVPLMGDACNQMSPGSVGSAQTNPVDGTYAITGLPAGNYYLRSDNMNQANYLNEWHVGNAAPDQSSPDCHLAALVGVSAGGSTSGKDFALDDAFEISGHVYDSTGTTPIPNISVQVTTQPPCDMWQSMGWATTDVNGAYSIKGLPAFTYYVGTNNMNQLNFVNEWWNGNVTDPSDFDCSLAAQPTYASGVATADFKVDQGAVISGSVKNSDGSALIEDANIAVLAVVMPSAGACQSGQWAGWTSTNFTGTYTLQGIPASSGSRFIYLQANNQNMSNYSNEWWNGQTVPSNPDCNLAVNLATTAGGALPDTDFWLAIPGSISGTVTGEFGPIKGVDIGVFGGPCKQDLVGGATTNGDGAYTVLNVPSGNYYIGANPENSHQNYVGEWYDGSGGTRICAEAGTAAVSSGANTTVDFVLDTGPVRADEFKVFVEQGGLLQVQFGVEERFQHQLKSAVLTLPAASNQEPDDTYSFDLEIDSKSWTSECRADQWWQKKFGTIAAGDYGEYTLTLNFDTDGNGSADTFETYRRTLTEVIGLNPVTGVNVTVNPGGGVDVNWTAPGSQTGKYYQVKIRSTDGSNEYYSSSQFPIDTVLPFHIPGSDLGCLTIGDTYSWLVRVLDDQGDFQNRFVQTGVNQVYNPTSDNVSRVIGTEVSVRAFNGHMNFQFDVAPGSRSKIVRARVYAPGVNPVTDPDTYAYEFNLIDDYYDYSTASRFLNGYQYQDGGAILSDGNYTFVIQYDDNSGGADFTDTIVKNFTAAAVTPVDVATMYQAIHPDGTISFFWDTPAAGQTYNVRIRNLAGDREYFNGGVGVDGTEVFAGLEGVSAMEVGQEYQWFIRANNGTNSVQSSSITFLYDPFLEPHASGATFEADSAVLTNTWLTASLGDRWDFAGYGNMAGATKYWVAEAVEEIDGVSCLKVRFQGNGNNPNPELDPEAHEGWLAQDTDGKVWVLKIYDIEYSEEFYYGKADAVLWMPAAPQVGQVFRQFLGMTTQVMKADLDVAQLSTGLGPFSGCLQLLTFDDDGEPGDISYECPGFNTVKEEWANAMPETGWELMPEEEKQEKFEGDFDGNGTTDILWRNTSTGEVAVWLMNGAEKTVYAYGAVPVAWDILNVGLYNSDMTTDILWRNTTTGELAVWGMNGAAPATVYQYGTVPLEWQVKNIGQFDLSSTTDDLLWRNTSTGEVAVWLMNGAEKTVYAYGAVPVAWDILNVGLYNSDMTTDILWRNTTTGELAIWGMNGAAPATVYQYGTVPLEWQVKNIGQFDLSSATDDLLWRNTSTGEVAVWLMNGAEKTVYAYGAVPAAWDILNVGLYNSDTTTDILWRNTTTGELAIWGMNGAAPATVYEHGAVPLEWQVKNIGQFDLSSTTDDLLWRNTSTGEVAVWLMNGAEKTVYAYGAVPVVWDILNVGLYNSDTTTDILWRNTTTGELAIWGMNGAAPATVYQYGTVPLEWQVVK